MTWHKLANKLSIFFLCAAVAMLTLNEPAMAMACCAMSGVYKIEGKEEE